jgi:hypothetical protein
MTELEPGDEIKIPLYLPLMKGGVKGDILERWRGGENYQVALRKPGISPFRASSRRQSRQSPKRR